MTTANKILAGLLISVGALGGAFGGGYYVDLKQRRVVEKQLADAEKKNTTLEEGLTKDLVRARGRSQILEAVLALVYQNSGLAFDRTVRAQGLSGRIGLNLQTEMDEVRMLITQQKPEAIGKLLNLADKFESVVGLTLPNAAPPPVKPPALAPTPATQPASAAAQAAPSPAAPAATASPELEPVREALRQAKEIVLVGGELTDAARKLARAQVLLNEAGNTSLDAELGAAIKAARIRDEARVRSSIDQALTHLRSP